MSLNHLTINAFIKVMVFALLLITQQVQAKPAETELNKTELNKTETNQSQLDTLTPIKKTHVKEMKTSQSSQDSLPNDSLPNDSLPNECIPLAQLLAKPSINRQKLSDLLAPSYPQNRRYRSARKLLFSKIAPDQKVSPPLITALYTGQRKSASSKKAPSGFNCEHLWPRAWMSSKKSAAYRKQEADLHNLYPSEIRVNSRRGHLPFGIVVKRHERIAHPSAIGADAHGNEVVEIRDEFKGDVARSLIYMSARWGLSFPPQQDLEILAQWSEIDPPSAIEKERNSRIQAVQGNLNPFVQCPTLTRLALKHLKNSLR